MPFIPHTTSDIAEMLKAIGVNSIENLFQMASAKWNYCA
jgi:glycine cleavage system pyridoxal-binding protein P